MTTTPVTAEDLCLNAMHLLDASEEAELEEFLRHSSEARGEMDLIRGDMALLAFTVQPMPVSPALRQRVLKHAAPEPESAPALAPKRSAALVAEEQPLTPALADDLLSQDSYTPSSRETVAEEAPATVVPRWTFSPVSLWAGWALAAGLAVSSGLLYTRAHGLQTRLHTVEAMASRATEDQRQTAIKAAGAMAALDALSSASSQHFVLTPQGAVSSPVAHIVYSPDRGALVLQAANLPPLAPGQTYAVWLFLAQGNGPPEKVGTLQPDAHGLASLVASSRHPGVLADRIEVSMENESGPQIGPPTIIPALSP